MSAVASEPSVTPAEAVDAANRIFGRHPGCRALHAKGILVKGTFTATRRAANLSRALHLQGEPVPVTVRFSDGGGTPHAPDYLPEVRGMAVKFYLPDGTRTDIVAQTAPRFPVSTPDAFVELLQALEPARVAWKLPLFLARHPRAATRLATNARLLAPPRSYATVSYFAVHAFGLTAPDGTRRHGRYRLIPAAGERRLDPLRAARRGRDYLADELLGRLRRGPVRFRLQLQLAAPGDRLDDPSIDWPEDRELVDAGTIELTGRDTERERAGDILVFDPTRMVDGLELSGDPVLHFRRAAYSESVARRAGR